MALFDRIADKSLLVRRIHVTANRVVAETAAEAQPDGAEQLDLFTDYQARDQARREEQAALEREKRQQKAVLAIKKKYGKNAILKGMPFLRPGVTQAKTIKLRENDPAIISMDQHPPHLPHQQTEGRVAAGKRHQCGLDKRQCPCVIFSTAKQ